MSDEKKPVATPLAIVSSTHVVGSTQETWWLCIGGRDVASGDEDELRSLAADIESAVEQREAKLRGALALVRPYVENASQRFYDGTQGEERRREARRRLEVVDAALAGTGPDYVPAEQLRKAEADLAAMRKHIEGTWGVLLEAFSREKQEYSPTTIALLLELGFDVKNPLSGVADALLIDEFQQRFQNTTPVRARDALKSPALQQARAMADGATFTQVADATREQLLGHHHQACDDLARNLIQRGARPDEVTRLVETPNGPVLARTVFAFRGLQWAVTTALHGNTATTSTEAVPVMRASTTPPPGPPDPPRAPPGRKHG